MFDGKGRRSQGYRYMYVDYRSMGSVGYIVFQIYKGSFLSNYFKFKFNIFLNKNWKFTAISRFFLSEIF